jgi:hypothetical protein
MMANRGTIYAYGTPLFEGGKAITHDAAGYRGEAFFAEDDGTARVAKFTANTATIEVSDAKAGALLVYNMNYDPSWSADGEPADEWKGLVAHRLTKSGPQAVRLRYFPRTLPMALVVFTLTVLASLWLWRRARRQSAA